MLFFWVSHYIYGTVSPKRYSNYQGFYTTRAHAYFPNKPGKYKVKLSELLLKCKNPKCSKVGYWGTKHERPVLPWMMP